jgi:hypothetical protein
MHQFLDKQSWATDLSTTQVKIDFAGIWVCELSLI